MRNKYKILLCNRRTGQILQADGKNLYDSDAGPMEYISASSLNEAEQISRDIVARDNEIHAIMYDENLNYIDTVTFLSINKE